MATITTQEARGAITRALIDMYNERVRPTGFLRSFFPDVLTSAKNVSWEVRRSTEKIAKDVARGSEGNRNKISHSTEKITTPPYYREFFDATQLDLYDRMVASQRLDASMTADFVAQIADNFELLQDKIERAYELQAAEVLQDRTVTSKFSGTLNFFPKADSIVDKSGEAWTSSSVDPKKHLKEAGNFIRQQGKAQGGVLNVICGDEAFDALINNAIIQKHADLKDYDLMIISEPQRNASGGTFHGRISAGAYKCNIWTYPEFYDNDQGVSTPYIDPKKIVVLPESPRFRTAFGAVPQLIDADTPRITRGAYVVGQFKDERNSAHIYDIKSAGLCVPVAVDQVVTYTVIGAGQGG